MNHSICNTIYNKVSSGTFLYWYAVVALLLPNIALIFAFIIWIDGLFDFIFTPYLFPCRITSGCAISISSRFGTTTP